jgi:hypothetical protein
MYASLPTGSCGLSSRGTRCRARLATVDDVILRCTAKVFSLLRVARSRVEDHPASEADWYANLIWVEGRKCLLVTHAGTLFTVFVPDVRAADLRPLGPFLVERIHAALAMEGLPPEALGRLVPEALRLAKTADRRVLGTMNDAAMRCEWIIGDDGGLAKVDLAALHHHLQSTPNGARGYARPIDLVRGWASNSTDAGPVEPDSPSAAGTDQPSVPEPATGRRGQMVPAAGSATSRLAVYQLKVTLGGVRPPIWRRVLVPGRASLAEVHTYLQVAMGWNDSHLHEFEINGRRYGMPDPDWDDGEVQEETRARLDRVAAAGDRLCYTYDFGDGWDHEIVVEKILPADPHRRYPACVAGRRCCPPEDVGGPGGYEDFLAAIADRAHPEHGDYLTWSGPFDPEAFSLGEVNDALAEYSW